MINLILKVEYEQSVFKIFAFSQIDYFLPPRLAIYLLSVSKVNGFSSINQFLSKSIEKR